MFGEEQLLTVEVAEVQSHPIVQQEVRHIRVHDPSQFGSHLNILAILTPAIGSVGRQISKLNVARDFHAAVSLPQFGNRNIRPVGKRTTVDNNRLTSRCQQARFKTRDVKVRVGLVAAVVKVRPGIKASGTWLIARIDNPHVADVQVLRVAQDDARLAVPNGDTIHNAVRQVERVDVQVSVCDTEPLILFLCQFTVTVVIDLKPLATPVGLVVGDSTEWHIQSRNGVVVRNQ